MKAYLTPFVYSKDLIKSDKEAQIQYMDRVKTWREEHRLKVEGVESDSDEEDVDFDAGSEDDLNEVDNAEKKKEESSDEENKPDEDFIDPDDIIVKHDDMDQFLKGYRVEKIGGTISLNKD